MVESTGFWYWLAGLLEELGVELTLAHATRLKAIAAAKVKTERLDSDLLAQLLRADLIPAAHRIGRWIYYLTASPKGARLFRAEDETGRRELVVPFDDPDRQPVWWNVNVGRGVLIVELGDHESDIWVMDLEY